MLEWLTKEFSWYPERVGRTLAFIKYGRSTHWAFSSQVITSPKFARRFEDGKWLYTQHAETGALTQLPYDYKPSRVKMYVVRFMKRGGVGMAKPCGHCQEWLDRYEIKRRNVWYTNENGELTRWE